MTKINTIQVLGRRWRDSYGNTYHTTEIVVNDKPMDRIKSKIAYGYDNAYRQQTLHDLLLENGYDVPQDYTEFTRFLFDTLHTCEVKDVKRKKDL